MSNTKERNEVISKLYDAGIYPDSIRYSTKENLFVVKRVYFYHHGMSAQSYAENIGKALDGVQIISAKDFWKPWPKKSYFEVKFRVLGGDNESSK